MIIYSLLFQLKYILQDSYYLEKIQKMINSALHIYKKKSHTARDSNWRLTKKIQLQLSLLPFCHLISSFNLTFAYILRSRLDVLLTPTTPLAPLSAVLTSTLLSSY